MFASMLLVMEEEAKQKKAAERGKGGR